MSIILHAGGSAQRRRTRGRFARDTLLRGCSAWALNREVNEDFAQGLRRSIEERVRATAVRGADSAGGTGGSGDGPRLTRSGSSSDFSSESDFEEPPPLSVPNSLKVKSWEELNARLAAASWKDAEEEDVKQFHDWPLQGRWWIISPRNPWKMRWDILTGLLVIYTIVVLPYRIGFDSDATGASLVFDYCVDVIFALDTCLSFCIGYYSDSETYISDPKLIARRYLKGFFVPDFLSWVPLDLIIRAVTGESSRSLQGLKFIRLVRLAKLMRLLKLSRFLVNLGERYRLNPSAIRLVKLMVKIMFLAHLLACFWHFIALPICGDESSLASHEPCPDEDKKVHPNWIRAFGADKFSLAAQYVVSLHFVTATMMAVGYGDVHATNTVERVVSVFMQCLGATAFGFILAAVTKLVDSQRPMTVERRKRMAEIKEWMIFRRMPTEMRLRVREHFHYAHGKRSHWVATHESMLLDNMTTVLRDQIVKSSYGKWVRCLRSAFPEEHASLLTELAQLLNPFQVAYGEVVLEAGEIGQEVHVVLSGVMQVVIEPRAMAASEAKPQDWARTCLKIGADEAPLVMPTSRKDLEADDASPRRLCDCLRRAVLCGFFCAGEVFGMQPACPVTVCGTYRRCELLSVSKDGLLFVLGKCPGAERRFAHRDRLREQELLKVLASSHSEGGPSDADSTYSPVVLRPSKALLLVGGKATLPDSLPLDLEILRRMESPDDYADDSLPLSSEYVQQTHNVSSLGTFSNRTHGNGLVRTIRESALVTDRSRGMGETTVETIETEAEILRRSIIPPFHKWKFRWDCVVGALIVYSVLIIPYRIGLVVTLEDFEIAIDLVVDFLFCIDMALHFRTAFVDSEGLTNTIPREIQARYLRSWFAIDLCSTVPIDLIVEAIFGGMIRGAEALKLLRILRLVRLLKLARLLKMGRLVRSFEEVVEVSPIFVKVFKLAGQLVVLAHFLGCFWFYTSMQQDLEVDACSAAELGCSPTAQTSTNWWLAIDISEESKGDQYVASLYWAFTTMTTVGYGEIVPKNNYERVYAIVAMMMGAPIFGYIVGSIAALASQNHSSFEAQAKKRLGTVAEFCSEQNVSRPSKDKVQKHYQFLYSQSAPHLEPCLLAELPAPLRREVTLFIHRAAICRIGLFVGADLYGLPDGPLPSWFVAWTMRLLEPQAASKGDDILRADEQATVHEIFFLTEGECEAYHFVRGIDRSSSMIGSSFEMTMSQQLGQCTGVSSSSPAASAWWQSGAVDPLGELASSNASATPPTTVCVDERHSTGASGHIAQMIPPIFVHKSEEPYRNRDHEEECSDPKSPRVPQVLMSFGPGCMFGLEHHLDEKLRYSVRCGKHRHCFVYVLRQATIAEVAQCVPEMAAALRNAATSALLHQMKIRATEYNLIRRLREREMCGQRDPGVAYSECQQRQQQQHQHQQPQQPDLKPVLPTAYPT